MSAKMPMLVDIAGNLTNKAFRGDLRPFLARAAGAGVGAIVIPGISGPASHRARAIVLDHDPRSEGPAGGEEPAGSSRPVPRLFATAGFHPHHARDASPAALADVAKLCAEQTTVAVGECGLDYNRDFSPREDQRRAFEAQLEIAARVKKPVYLHERDAHEDFLAILTRWRPSIVGGVVHCFTGDRRALERYLALDLHIGFTGWICDERRGTHLRDLVGLVPRGRLMVETDAPYILPRDMPNRPKSGQNEPAFVIHVAKTVARHRGESFEDLAAHSTATAERLFRLAT